MYKRVAVLAVLAVSSFWFWVVAKAWVASEIKFALVSVWLWPLVALIVESSLIAVALLVLTEFKWAWAVSWIMGLEFVAIFGLTNLNVIAALIIVALFAYAAKVVAVEARDRTHLHSFLIFRRGLSWIIFPLSIAVSFAYYQSPALTQRVAAGVASPTIEQVVSVTAEAFLQSQGEKLSDRQKEEFKNQVTHRALQEVSFFGERYKQYLPPVLAFGLFLILWGLEFIFVYICVFLAMAVFSLLRATKFVTIKIKQVDSEFIQL